MSEAIRIVRLHVEGRVQGVGYRAWTADVAAELGLEGWVRNRRDGSVEALFAGPPDRVAGMLERCRQGPWAANVTSMEIEEEGGEAFGPGFHTLPTL
jgi:acylphosphatase